MWYVEVSLPTITILSSDSPLHTIRFTINFKTRYEYYGHYFRNFDIEKNMHAYRWLRTKSQREVLLVLGHRQKQPSNPTSSSTLHVTGNGITSFGSGRFNRWEMNDELHVIFETLHYPGHLRV